MATPPISFQPGLEDSRDVDIYNEQLKAIWHQEHILLNKPLANFYEYEFVGSGDPLQVQKNLVRQFINVPVSVPNLDEETIVNGGGLILPTDRFLSAYDVNPHIMAVVEWPAQSGYLFTFARKEYNPDSGRLETLIRQGNHLKGVIYGRVKSKTFKGAQWGFEETVERIVITANRNDLDYSESLVFGGVAVSGDLVFWAKKDGFKLSDDTSFIPAVHDYVYDVDHLGNEEVYQVIGTRFDAREDYYRLLCRRNEEA